MSLLAVPLNVHVLEALAEEPRSLVDLRRAVGSPPQTTLRGHLRKLTELGVLERRRRTNFPGNVDFALGPAGADLLGVAGTLQSWLAGAPDGPVTLGSLAARSAIKALVDGWDSAIVRALAARPLALTDLNRLISDLNYPSLERRLAAMRLSGQVEATAASSRGTPYAASDWLRRAVAPLAAAARWERRFAPESSATISRLDVEAAFLLAVPLAQMATEASGVCRLAVEVRRSGNGPGLVGVITGIDQGRIVSCIARLDGSADASVSGSVSAWIQATIEDEVGALEVSGARDLAGRLLISLRRALSPTEQLHQAWRS